VLDSKVRELRDLFVTQSWSRQLYNGMCRLPPNFDISILIMFIDLEYRFQPGEGICGGRINCLPEELHRRCENGGLPW
jgi:hypothetical protein